jgi:hypothetical protein
MGAGLTRTLKHALYGRPLDSRAHAEACALRGNRRYRGVTTSWPCISAWAPSLVRLL